MADGGTKPISQVEVGDKVLATDPQTGEQVARAITKVWVHEDTFVDLRFEGATITTTPDHRFYNATDDQFQRANALDPGDKVLTDDGRTLTVISPQPGTERRAVAYNLTIRGIHTYHVGYANILVHNDCIPSGGRSRNDKIGCPVGSALKSDAWHRAPSFVMDDIAENGTVFRLVGGDGKLTHQMFVKRGAISGIPVVP